MTKSKPVSCDPDAEWQAEEDARTLTRSQEVRDDAKRYKKACAKLTEQAESAKAAVDLETKVKAGLNKAFGDSDKKEC